MDSLLFLLPVAGCAAMMVGMVWMMRGRSAGHGQPATPSDDATRAEIAALRAELTTLRERTGSPETVDRRPGGAARE